MRKKTIRIPVYLLFILATVLIILLFPREGEFRYSFNENRPWNYGLLTAPFDFPIYKTADEIAAERDSIAANIKPYFQINKDIYTTQAQRIDEYAFESKSSYRNIRQTLKEILNDLYTKGVLSDSDYEKTEKANQSLMIIDKDGDGIAKPVQLNRVYSQSEANDILLKSFPPDIDYNFFGKIQPNLIYDEEYTGKVKQGELQMLSISTGKVQAGEKIIDRGEIVTHKIFNTLNSLKQIYDNSIGTQNKQIGAIGGIIVLVGGLMLCLFLYFFFLRRSCYSNQKDIICILLLLLIFVVLTELTVKYNLFNVYIIPYAIIPIVIRVFFDSRTAQMTHLITTLICSLMVPLPFEFILLQLVVCMASIYALKDLTQRSELIICAFYILFTYILIYLGYQFMREDDFTKIQWPVLIYFAINFLFVMFTYAFIYIIEKIFGYISNVTLVELSDINRPVLQQLSETSPGTFQHSLQVSMLGTAAAVKVNANPQLVRTGALYHDLGKMENPAYFTENKVGNTSPHDKLSPEESAKIITSHVPNGIKIAEKYGLPPALIKFIQTHHGQGKAKYFYNTYKNQHPDEPVNEKAFAYEGVNPDTKETAILMMADSVEAASRSLKDYSEISIRELVNKIIDGQIADGLLSEAPLTFKDITNIKEVFIDKLMSVYHSRISYPELSKEEK